MTADLDRDTVRELEATPRGTRRILRVTGGAFEGPALTGDGLPGGGEHAVL